MGGGTLSYGCYKGTNIGKPWTEYYKNTSRDYQAYTVTPSGTAMGNRTDDNLVSKHADQALDSGGMVYFKVKIFK